MMAGGVRGEMAGVGWPSMWKMGLESWTVEPSSRVTVCVW